MTGYEHLCMNCMADTEGKAQCPHCGFSEEEPQQQDALPYRTVLQERYMIGRVKYANSEGFSYIGFDLQQLCVVQIREFFPREICVRVADSTDIAVIAGNEGLFESCLSDFVNYQETVAKFQDQPALVPVLDIFEENYTAYSVSAWEESLTLRYFVKRSGGTLSWNAAWQLFMPVISAVSALYASGVGHYGISPDTLYIMKDGSMKLGSFCSESFRAFGNGLQPDLTPGCAAIEQYDPDETMGECTDVYGMASSLFFVLTGRFPKEAPERRKDARLLLPSSTLHSIPPHVITAIANALQVEPESRTPTFERFRAELSAAPTATASLEETQSLRRIPSPYDDSVDQEARARLDAEQAQDAEKKSIPRFVWAVLGLVAVLVCTTIGVVIYQSSRVGVPNVITASAGSGSSSAVSGAALSQSGASGAGEASGASDASSVGSAVSGSSAADASASASGASSDSSSSKASDDGQIEVPNLVGKRFSSLQNTEAYQVVQTSKEFSDSIPEGCIISQSPAAGSGKMVKGAAVSVTVSLGKALRTLPDISGKTYDEARSAVAAAGFVPDGKKYEYSDSVKKGLVIGYGDGLTAGSKLNYQYSVTIFVSLGPDDTDDDNE